MGDRVGAVVALDPRSGEILAMLSAPSYDPNLFARRLQVDDWQAILNAPNNPLQNRVMQNTYSPGSVFKIIIAIAGSPSTSSVPTTAWCATASPASTTIRSAAGSARATVAVNLRDALRGSCDIYFYQLGQRLGIERIAHYARLFGFSLPTGIDIGGEKTGLVPDPRWSLKARGTPWYPGETISVAIGQGPLLVTPLQMAAMMAAVANGGARVTPHIMRGRRCPDRRRCRSSLARCAPCATPSGRW
jgi:penicillin-binding protein 2